MFAVPLGLFAVSLPDALRPRAFGINAAMWGVSALIGPLLGAVLTATVGWRWVFWINLPLIAIVAWAARARCAGSEPAERVRERRRLNIVGPVLLGLVVAVLLAVTKHWLPPLVLLPLALVPAVGSSSGTSGARPRRSSRIPPTRSPPTSRRSGPASRSSAPRRTCRSSSRSASATASTCGYALGCVVGVACSVHARVDDRVDDRRAPQVAAAQPDRARDGA